jgi:TrmH family RNA methyltransferase
MTLITSRQNPKIKQIRALSRRKERQKTGLFVVEGIRHVGEAVESGADIEYMLHAPDLLESDFAYSLLTKMKLKNVPVYTTTTDIFSDLAGRENPQGILGVVRQMDTSLSTLNEENLRWGVVIENPQDPGNLGTILRTLDAAGGDGLIVIGSGTDIQHPKAVRASMGTVFWKPVVYVSMEEFKAWKKVHNYHLYGSSASGSEDYGMIGYQPPALLMLGSEREGLSNDLLSMCEAVVRLPMKGRATSLNLSVAAGILIYQMMHGLKSK